MNVCKCLVPSRHGGTLNSRQAASPLVKLVEGEERWEAPDHPSVNTPRRQVHWLPSSFVEERKWRELWKTNNGGRKETSANKADLLWRRMESGFDKATSIHRPEFMALRFSSVSKLYSDST
ncbi:UNVERIFIED_CONTAM: hypothetical protein NCL1_36120 [Trichonephila clavipes]